MTNTPPGAPALAPCPFCGGEANFYTWRDPKDIHRHSVDVDDEGLACRFHPETATYIGWTNREEAAAAWNRRPAEDALREKLAALESDLASARAEIEFVVAVATSERMWDGEVARYRIAPSVYDRLKRFLNRETT